MTGETDQTYDAAHRYEVTPNAMTLVELAITMQCSPGWGEALVTTVLRRLAVLRLDPGHVLQMSDADAVHSLGLDKQHAGSLLSSLRAHAAEAQDVVGELGRLDVRVVTICDAAYPECLVRWLPDPPPVLTYLGDLALIGNHTVAVLNSNRACEDAAASTDHAVAAALGMGAVLVVGHNRPEYRRPALLARRSGRAVCYVLDRGVLPTARRDWRIGLFPAARVWPPPLNGTDLLLSSFGPTATWLADFGRRRDAIVDALAAAAIASFVKDGGVMHGLIRRRTQHRRPVAWVQGASLPPDHINRLGVDIVSATEEEHLRAWLAGAFVHREDDVGSR